MPALPFDEDLEPEKAGHYDGTARRFAATPRLNSTKTKLLGEAIAEYHRLAPSVVASLRGLTVDFSHL